MVPIKNFQMVSIYLTYLPFPQVKCTEGRWPGNRTVSIIHFSSERNARQYLESDPTVKQPDFMDGMDIIMVHTQKQSLPSGKCKQFHAIVYLSQTELHHRGMTNKEHKCSTD